MPDRGGTDIARVVCRRAFYFGGLAMTMVQFGIIIFMGAIGLGIGCTKKRPLAGFLWGALLGPIGWLVIGVAKEVKNEQ